MHRSDWQDQRRKVLDAQSNKCAREDCPHVGSLDVIRVGKEWVGFCRRHRLRIDAAERCGKAARTRASRKAQRSWL